MILEMYFLKTNLTTLLLNYVCYLIFQEIFMKMHYPIFFIIRKHH